jgi:hypothetical protein
MGKNIIEFIGPPGVGKSSIYKSLCKQWNANHNWIHQDALLAPPKPSLLKFTRWLEHTTQVLLGRKLAKTLPLDYGLRFVNNHKELAALCWNHLSDPGFFNDQAMGRRFRAAYFLFLDYCRYQAILEANSRRTCIIDEGFLQKSFLILDDKQAMEDLVKRYVSVLPLPYAIIYVDTPDQELIKNRLRNRKKGLHPPGAKPDETILAETGKWQHLLQMIVDIIQQDQVIIHRVDGAKPIPENVKSIHQFLTRIS